MNERIEKLTEQVDLLGDFTPTKIDGRYVGYINVADIEKFAELIVAECIKCADHVGLVNAASAYPNSTAYHIKQKIKEHFGVEE